jgi:hypothetical protein
MSMELARRNEVLPSRTDWQTMREMAEAFHESGLLPTWIKNPLAALAVIQKGAELGLSPMYSLSRISMIEGKPACDAEAMAALCYRDHGPNAFRFVKTTTEECTLEYCRRGGTPGTLTFSIEDARRAGLLGKQNWQKYPQAMLRARAVSAAARMAFPDTIGGLYTAEELGAEVDVDEHGEMTIVDVPDHPAPAVGSQRDKAEARRIVADDGRIVKDNEPTPIEQARAERLVDEDIPTPRRQKLIDKLRGGLAKARDLRLDVKDIDPAGLSDASIREAIDALADLIRAAELPSPAEDDDF